MANDNLTPGSAGGTHISGTPATTENLAQASPELLRNYIDQRIVKIRPMSTPIDQLTRCASTRRADSMKVEYYSVDTKATETTYKSVINDQGDDQGNGIHTFKIKTTADSIFEASETILVPDVMVDGKPLVLYVVKRHSDCVEVMPVNGIEASDIEGTYMSMPKIPADARLVRMGRAATELDVQTPQFAATPKKASNNCQIFK